MPDSSNNMDARTIRQRRTTAAIVLGATLLVGASPFLLPMGWLVISMVQMSAERNRLTTDVDHLAVRDAARSLLGMHERNTFVDVAQLPDDLARLEPNTAHVDDRGFLKLEFGGGFHHHGLLIVPQEAEGITLDLEPPLQFTPLEDGIWFYEET